MKALTGRPDGQTFQYFGCSNAFHSRRSPAHRRYQQLRRHINTVAQIIRHQRGKIILLGACLVTVLSVVMGACVAIWIG